MASINFTGLENKNSENYLYRDFLFDLEELDAGNPNNPYRSKQAIDVAASFDEGAIKNSVKNIFNTSPGEKLLTPEFGLALKRYLFAPLTQDTAESIGEDIIKGIERYEPRVRIDRCDVVVNYDDNEYAIVLTLTIPPLNILQKQYAGFLSQNGFSFL
jgi:phage baseplate assembly protein W